MLLTFFFLTAQNLVRNQLSFSGVRLNVASTITNRMSLKGNKHNV